MKRYYAVKAGRKTGIFESWFEVEPLVSGFSGAKFKGFNFRDEAVMWLGHNGKSVNKKKSKTFNPHPARSECNLTSFYSGKTPPWDFPSFIACIEHEVNVNGFRWKA